MRPLIYLGGTFDLLHGGHVALFANARQHGRVVVALNTDEFAARYKRPPVMTLAERRAVVKGMRDVDYVTVNEGCEDSTVTIRKWRPRFIGHGDDWTGDSLMAQMGLTSAFLAENRIEMLTLPYTPGISSSDLRQRLLGGAF